MTAPTAPLAGPTSTIDYRPSLFLINGESYTNESMATIAAGTAGQIDAPSPAQRRPRTHAPVLDNGSLQIVAEDGNMLPFAKDQAAVMLAAGKTHDALWTPAARASTACTTARSSLNAPGQGAAGMLAKLSVGGGRHRHAGATRQRRQLIGTAKTCRWPIPRTACSATTPERPTAARS